MSILANIPERVRDTMFTVALICPVVFTGILSPANPINSVITTIAIILLIWVLIKNRRHLASFCKSSMCNVQTAMQFATAVILLYAFCAAILVLAFCGAQSFAYLFF